MPMSTNLFKPYLWLAAIGFAVGFMSYVAVHPATSNVTLELPSGWASAASAPASDDWNLPKEI
jgi:hypothetical protein